MLRYNPIGRIRHLQKAPQSADFVEVVAFDDPKNEWGIFSNYAATPIHMTINYPGTNRSRNVTFPTVEHYFQFMKDPDNENHLQSILKNPSPENARRLGKNVNIEVTQPDWENVSKQVMKDALVTKAEQHPAFFTALMNTGTACLVEDTGARNNSISRDGKWGFKLGGETDGNQEGNLLGQMLMDVRNDLYENDNQAQKKVNSKNVSNEVKQIMQRHYQGKSLSPSASDAQKIPDTNYKISPPNERDTPPPPPPLPPSKERDTPPLPPSPPKVPSAQPQPEPPQAKKRKQYYTQEPLEEIKKEYETFRKKNSAQFNNNVPAAEYENGACD